jgi:hypothetical protein
MAGQARAHRLEADFKILPGGRIRIETWFDTGESPFNARILVHDGNGQKIAEGPVDENGCFEFTAPKVENLHVVVSDGTGHRKELTIRGDPWASTESRDAPRHLDRPSPSTMKDIIIGISFVLAVAAFVLAWRNARALRALKNQGK